MIEAMKDQIPAINSRFSGLSSKLIITIIGVIMLVEIDRKSVV